MLYEDVLRSFGQSGVQFLIGGGLAVNLHGAPRGTYDLDLFLEMSEENITKAVNNLLELDYEPRLPVDPLDFADPDVRQQWIETKNMNAFTFHHIDQDLHVIDFLFNLPLDYEDCRPSAVHMMADDLKIPVVSIDDLVTLKKQADRPIDQLDVSMLEKLKELDHD